MEQTERYSYTGSSSDLGFRSERIDRTQKKMVGVVVTARELCLSEDEGTLLSDEPNNLSSESEPINARIDVHNPEEQALAKTQSFLDIGLFSKTPDLENRANNLMDDDKDYERTATPGHETPRLHETPRQQFPEVKTRPRNHSTLCGNLTSRHKSSAKLNQEAYTGDNHSIVSILKKSDMKQVVSQQMVHYIEPKAMTDRVRTRFRDKNEIRSLHGLFKVLNKTGAVLTLNGEKCNINVNEIMFKRKSKHADVQSQTTNNSMWTTPVKNKAKVIKQSLTIESIKFEGITPSVSNEPKTYQTSTPLTVPVIEPLQSNTLEKKASSRKNKFFISVKSRDSYNELEQPRQQSPKPEPSPSRMQMQIVEAQNDKDKLEIESLRKEVKTLQAFYEQHKDEKESLLDVGFLFASPLIYMDKTGQNKNKAYSVFGPIHFDQEVNCIKEAVADSNQVIVFQSTVATISNFSEMLNKKPRVLHISCHGIANNAKTMGSNFDSMRSQGDFLLFEDESGQGQLASESKLKELIRESEINLDLVFVAACDSEQVGRIFHSCGAKHVVCVKKDKNVLDSAAVKFTRIFYQNLLAQETICQSFKRAKEAVAADLKRSESDLFLMILKEDEFVNGLKIPQMIEDGESNHICYAHQKRPKGQLICNSEHIKVKSGVPAQVKCTQNTRERAISKLVKSIMNGKRLVTLLGLYGIGKSTVVTNAVHYMVQRKYFSGGIIYINMKQVRSMRIFMQKLKSILLLKMDLSVENMDKKLANTQQEEFLDLFIDIVNGRSGSWKKEKTKHSSKLNNSFLICLDNAEQLISKENQKFNECISDLLNRIPQLSIILTSRKGMGVVPNCTQPELQFLNNLKAEQDVELFLNNTKAKIMPEHVYNLILEDPTYDIGKVFPEIKSLQQPVSEEKRRSTILKKLRQEKFSYQALANHDLFKQLSGNPLSIITIASLHANPLFKENSLIELYKKIKSEQNNIYKDEKVSDTVSDLKENSSRPRFNANRMSLRISTQASLKLINDTVPESYDLFYFLGCLPDGITRENLAQLWDSNIENSLKPLESLSFFGDRISSSKLTLTPFLVNFIGDSIEQPSKEKFMLKIAEFYTNSLEHLYKINSAVGLESAKDSQQVEEEARKGIPVYKKMSKFGQNMQSQLNSSMKSSIEIERVINDLGNIENCIEYYIQVCNESHLLKQENLDKFEENEDSSSVVTNLVPKRSIRDDTLLQKKNTAKSNESALSLETNKDSEEFKFKSITSNRIKAKVPVDKEKERRQKAIVDNISKGLLGLELISTSRKQLDNIDEAECSANEHSASYVQNSTHSEDEQQLNDIYNSINKEQNKEEESLQNKAVRKFLKQKKSEEVNPDTRETLKSSQIIASFGAPDVEEKTNGEDVLNGRQTPRIGECNDQNSNIDFGEIARREEEESSDADSGGSKKSSIQDMDEVDFVDSASASEELQDDQEIMRYFSDKKITPISKQRDPTQTPLASSSDNFAQMAAQCNYKSSWKHQKSNTIKIHGVRSLLKKTRKQSKFLDLLDEISNKPTTNGTSGMLKVAFTFKGDRQIRLIDELNIPSHFLLLTVANTFLSSDYERCYQLCSTDFSFVTLKNNNFLGNMLRFKALALDQLISLKKEKERATTHIYAQISNLTALSYFKETEITKAVKDVQRAIDLFSVNDKVYERETFGKKPETGEPNSYSIALAQFQMGYLLEKYQETLVAADNASVQSSQVEQEDIILRKALTHYNVAFERFKEINHLKGMHLSRKHTLSTVNSITNLEPESLESIISSPNSPLRRSRTSRQYDPQRLEKQEQALLKQYVDYSKETGLHKSYHISRTQGEEISLMVELVLSNKFNDLFPIRETEAEMAKHNLMQKSPHFKPNVSKQQDKPQDKSQETPTIFNKGLTPPPQIKTQRKILEQKSSAYTPSFPQKLPLS